MGFVNSLVTGSFIGRRWAPFNVAAPVMGWIVAVLSVLLLLALVGVGLPSVRATSTPGHPGSFPLAAGGFVLVAAAQLGMLVGSIQMIRGDRSGKPTLILSLLSSIVFSLIYNVGIANLGQFVLQVVLRVVVYYFVATSRFPEERS